MESIRVRLLGPLEVSRLGLDGNWKVVEKTAWGKGTPARSVFKRLLTVPGRRLSRGDIQDQLWPGIGMQLAEDYLYLAANTIRRAIGKDLLRTVTGMYELAGQEQIWLDLDASAALLPRAENLGHSSLEASLLLEEASSYLTRGQCLEGEEGTWRHEVCVHVNDMRRQCGLWLAEHYEAAAKFWQASQQYRALAYTLPPDEEALLSWI